MFCFLAVLDDFAKVAGMFAVEGFLDRDRKRRILGIINHHRDPCDGLKKRPVPAHRNNQQKND